MGMKSRFLQRDLRSLHKRDARERVSYLVG
jgi:hypothetical protein